jgi:hypothetical protein
MPLIAAKRALDLIRLGRSGLIEWQTLPLAERERTRSSAERVSALITELGALTARGAARRVRHESPPADEDAGRSVDAVTDELRLAIQELLAGPAAKIVADTARPRTRRGRLAVKAAKGAAHRLSPAPDLRTRNPDKPGPPST